MSEGSVLIGVGVELDAIIEYIIYQHKAILCHVFLQIRRHIR